MNRNYGNHGEVKSNRENVQTCLEITFAFTEKSKVKIKIGKYVERIINEFPMKISKSDTRLTPDGGKCFWKG